MAVYEVPDMSCGHCQASIEKALQPLAESLAVDLERRQIRVEGLAPDEVIRALDAIGFEARLSA